MANIKIIIKDITPNAMNYNIKSSVLSFLLLCFFQLMLGSIAYGQIEKQIEEKAFQELSKHNITEEELRSKLLEKGIDLDQLKNLEPAQAAGIQKEIESAIKEIEAEKTEKSKQINSKEKEKKKPAEQPNKAKQLPPSKNKKDAPLEEKVGGIAKDSIIEEGKIVEQKIPVEIWGQEIFRNQSLAVYRQANDIKPPESYILGVGDQVSVAIWGLSQLNEVYEINADGYIAPNRMPRIFLKGAPLSRAREILKNYFRRFYRFNSNEFQVAVNYSRTINVNIFGEVFQYGGFTLPAINTAFNALIAAGGPTNLGSVRKIKLIRNGKETIMDVYKFMADPTIQKDFYLENNDIIQVPVADRVVQIQGYVNRPFKYELIDGENLKKLIEYAGGLNTEAIQNVIQVNRIENDRRIIIDVPYADLLKRNGDFSLRKGDIVTVSGIKTKEEEYIYVKGEVRSETQYQFQSNSKLSELVRKIQFTPESNKEVAFIRRTNPNQTISLLRVNLNKVSQGIEDQALQAKDELIVYKLSAYSEKGFVSVSGAARLPGKYDIDPNNDVRIKDLVLLAGGLKPDAWPIAFIFRPKEGNKKEIEIIRTGIRQAVYSENSDQNVLLHAMDSIVILSEEEFSTKLFVDVRGAVKSPGIYKYGKGMQALDAVSIAGGFQFGAATNRVDVFRVLVKDNEPTTTAVKTITINRNLVTTEGDNSYQIEPFDIIVVRNQPEFEFQQIVSIEGEVKYPGPYALIKPNETVADLIARAGGLTAEAFESGASLYRTEDNIGYVVLELEKALKRPGSRYNYIAKDGDRIEIPKKKDLVKITGATNAKILYPEKFLDKENAIAVAYYEGKNAKYYINRYAAGVSKQGDRNNITVQHANGRIEKARDYIFFKKYPKVEKGSTINVGIKEPKKLKADGKERKDVDWTKVTADAFAQMTAIISLVLLLQRL
ncbi:MAG TPA: SLBB domain-containing protein [Saprospiraceae bacterium]|nr:SLBB domain-containing protein [Saprospiraceae bacterium]